MSYHPAVLKGLALALQAAKLGVYREDGVFATTERGIAIQAFPETPPEVIGLFLYHSDGTAFTPTATRRLSTVLVQIKYRLRGHPFEGLELFDSLHDLIDRKHLEFDGVRVTGAYKSFSEIGQTATGVVFTSNWELSGLAPLHLVPPTG